MSAWRRSCGTTRWRPTPGGTRRRGKGDCKLEHSNGPYGENIFWGSGGAPWTASDAVITWVQEKQYYNCSDNSCTSGRFCNHYTQAVWATTTRLGCAAVACDAGRGTFIICNYDPAGNVVGRRPYDGCGGQFNRSEQNSPQYFLNLQNTVRAGMGIGMLSWDSSVASYAERYSETRKKDCQKVNSGSESSSTTTAQAIHVRAGNPVVITPSSSVQA